ncbi:MFS transporter [Actinorhabdospora filicis]|uniref:MFS transporter n=1 Tax=Actinorhabdospora filicis TaxID=1785913 RepID=A0A9W6W7U9_9ACTN|nr:MFS transporter [Actinorhabdospora filicis]GLZ75846.1 MFS transporter [Actinorhabdospora filicis]
MSDGQRERTATFGEVFAVGEFRALFVGDIVSSVGDMLARVAVTFLVWQQTGNVLLTVATFAISYAPYLIGAPVLAALAERYPYRRTMITCDLLRMGLIGLVAIPGTPLWAMLVLLFLVSAVTPAEKAARSALLPQVLEGERYAVALSAVSIARQSAQLAGYFAGGVLAGVNAHLALGIDAATFAFSALLLTLFVRTRAPGALRSDRSNLFKEAGQGITFVFGHPVLRSIALLVFCMVGCAIVPEAAAPAWAAHLHGGSLAQGAIMASAPVGSAIGVLVMGRFMSATTRQKLIRPLAIIAPMLLIPALFDPPVWLVLPMAAGVNMIGGVLLALNTLFVQALPGNFRARAFGVMQSGLMIAQGTAVIGMGLVAQAVPSIAEAVGLWGIAGVILVSILVLTWPSASTIEEAKSAAKPPVVEPPAEAPAPPAAPAAGPEPVRGRSGAAKAEA